MNCFCKLLESIPFLGRTAQARRLRREWKAAVAAEVLTDNPDLANWVVFQADGRRRYVADKLFARHGDIAHPIR